MAVDTTSKPVPNSSYDVARSNLETLDKYINSTDNAITNRVGATLSPLSAIQQAVDNVVATTAFIPVTGSFQAGGTLETRNDALLNTTDSSYYSWGGNLPKVVPAGSTPAIAGGIGLDKWVLRGDSTLRSQLAAINSSILVGGIPVQKLATRYNTDIGDTVSRPTSLTSTDRGMLYFDTTLDPNGKPIWWNGSLWIDATGTSV